MSRKELLTRNQERMIGPAIGGIILYAWALYSMDVLLSNLARTGYLIVFVGALCCLVMCTVYSGVRLYRVSLAKRRLYRRMTIWFGVSAIATSVVVAVITDWVVLNVTVRSAMSITFLPQGNLFVSAGRAGWTFVALLLLIGLALLSFKKAIDRIKKSLTIQRELPGPDAGPEDEIKSDSPVA